ncbi:hypothetical protein [Pseudonocardia lacus]|uniref:hypothetical protein n=1 Tax=Pseudonocardia lacus TaxID=2835865 RepID=UPI001BDDB8A2|nr:hypothetical protein [Pseudonocardia lacus]
MKQSLAVVRIHLVSWRFIGIMPVAILALVLVLNLALFGSMGDIIPPDGRTTGGVLSIYITVAVGYLQAMTQSFPFALGLSVTRRAFYAGTALLVAIEAAAAGALLLGLKVVEQASGGWGLGIKFFAIAFLVVDNPLLQWLIYAVPFAALSAMAVFVGVVFKRWGQAGVYALTIALGVGLAGAVVLITLQDWWPAFGGWFAEQTPLALFAGYPLVLALLLGGAGWLAIRRAIP